MKKSLFGGALVAAGLTAAPADAQFSFSYTAITVGAYAYGVSGPSFDDFSGPGFWSIAASEPGALGTSDGTPTSVDLFASADPGSGAFAYATASLFTVATDAVATASWDITDAGSFNITNLTDAVVLLSISNVSSGSMPIVFEAGKEYGWSGFISQTDGTGAGFASIVLPAPGSLALIALGGVFATRRRR